MTAPPEQTGSIAFAIICMLVLSLMLFWLPAFGPLIAGIVGGKVAGGVLRGAVAVIGPVVLLGVGIFASTSILSGMPLIGAVAAFGVTALLAVQLLPLLLGVAIGGLLA